MNISHDGFSALDDAAKMERIREYLRNRLGEGERLWWLEEQRTLPMQARL